MPPWRPPVHCEHCGRRGVEPGPDGRYPTHESPWCFGLGSEPYPPSAGEFAGLCRRCISAGAGPRVRWEKWHRAPCGGQYARHPADDLNYFEACRRYPYLRPYAYQLVQRYGSIEAAEAKLKGFERDIGSDYSHELLELQLFRLPFGEVMAARLQELKRRRRMQEAA